jgi:hypothetical protein
MEMQQMMEMLLKEIRAGQEQTEANRKKENDEMDARRKKDKEDFMAKLDANRRTDKEEMEAKRKPDKEESKINQAKLLATMEADQEEWRVGQEKLEQRIKAWREEIRAVLFETSITRKETMACQEMEARLEEEKPTTLDRKAEAAEER